MRVEYLASPRSQKNNLVVQLCRDKSTSYTTEPFQLIWINLTNVVQSYSESPLCVLSSSSFLWTQFCLILTKRQIFNLCTTRSQPMRWRKTALQWVLIQPIYSNPTYLEPLAWISSSPFVPRRFHFWQNQTDCQSAFFAHLLPAWYLQDRSHDYFAHLSLTCTSAAWLSNASWTHLCHGQDR